jgi:hypothetical protein
MCTDYDFHTDYFGLLDISKKNLHWIYTLFTLVLSATNSLLQLISTALLSDLQLDPLPG